MGSDWHFIEYLFVSIGIMLQHRLVEIENLDLVRRSSATSCNGFMETSRVELPAVFEEAPIDQLVHLIGI